MSSDQFTVEHQPDKSRYVLYDNGTTDSTPPVIGEESYVDVTADDGTTQRVMFHTGVSEDYAGQGLASVLVRAAVDDAVDTGHTIVPVCPYVKKWLPGHPEYEGHTVKPTRDHFKAVRNQQAL